MAGAKPLRIARLIIHCPDQPGIISSVTSYLKAIQANIIDLDQHVSSQNSDHFFMRLEFQVSDSFNPKQFEQDFVSKVANHFMMQWHLSFADTFKRIAVFVSKHDHALLELLWRVQRKELPITIPLIISNHEALKEAATHFKVPFHFVPVDGDSKASAEKTALQYVGNHVDAIVLARYMQVLSKAFIEQFAKPIINIHHSFLPAFKGADPYRQAFEKGVKLIGATAHFVTEMLDEGPIIAQDVVKVTHRHSYNDLRALGRDVERNALARAVKYFAEDRIILDKQKTIVFE